MMGTTPRYPLIRTRHHGDVETMPVQDRLHPVLSVVYVEGGPEIFGCGDSWCNGSGSCGLPAIVIPAKVGRREQKMYSSMTACGPLMQNWRVEWQGQKVEVPVEHQDDFQKRWWF